MKRFISLLLLFVCVNSFGVMHIHTDAADYRAGERIWFRVHELSADDEVLFVELIDPQGVVAKRIKILRWDDIFYGYIDIPSTCEAGQYIVRAFTRTMFEHMEHAGRQIVYVHGHFSSEQSSSVVLDELYLHPDSVPYVRVAMPLSVTDEADRRLIHVDTANLLPGERVFLSVSITDRYAISRHKQWTILESFARPPHVARIASGVSNGAAVRGRVVTPGRERPVSNAVVNMIVPGTDIFASDTTDRNGLFSFADELIPEGRFVLLAAFRSDGRQNISIRIDEDTFPAYTGVAPGLIRLRNDEQPLRIELNDITDSVLLQDIEVSAKRTYESKREKHSMYVADMSFGMNKIEEYNATCLRDLLLRVPGMRLENDQCFIRGAHSIYATNPAAIAINGVLQDEFYDLDLIPMQDIARVDIFKSGTTVIWGARGGAGVISIILKDGAEIPQQNVSSNLKRWLPLGWQQPQDFFIDPDRRSDRRPGTVLWEPNLHSGTIPLTVGAYSTIYDVVVEGLTSTGRLVREQTEIFVERPQQ